MSLSQCIALDAMGGDLAPGMVIEAVKLLEPEIRGRVILVGDESQIRDAGAEADWAIVHAEEVVGMAEPAGQAVRKKRRSSIAIGLDLVKQGKASAFVSAGNTGAVMAFALTVLGRLPGIHRPAIAAVFPTREHKPCLVADVGANVDCKPEQLLQFALMCRIYYREVIGHPNPRVGLLSIGSEDEKGNEATLNTLPLLRNSGMEFVGNVEGRDIIAGNVEVIVCDGFVGNVVLKFGESLAMMLMGEFGREIEKLASSDVAQSLHGAFRSLKKRVDYSEIGGAPLLGVNGVCLISHGSSSPKALANAVRTADQAIQHDINRHIIAEIGATAVA